MVSSLRESVNPFGICRQIRMYHYSTKHASAIFFDKTLMKKSLADGKSDGISQSVLQC